MRGTSLLIVLIALAATGPTVSAAAATQTTPNPKTTPVSQPPQQQSDDDIFTPLMRGTPGGRISGGTRGIRPRAASPAIESVTPAPTAAGGAGAEFKDVQAPVTAVAK
jgi:hypothetical protein